MPHHPCKIDRVCPGLLRDVWAHAKVTCLAGTPVIRKRLSLQMPLPCAANSMLAVEIEVFVPNINVRGLPTADARRAATSPGVNDFPGLSQIEWLRERRQQPSGQCFNCCGA